MILKQRIYEIIERARPEDRPNKIFDIFLIILINLNVLAIILESMEQLAQDYQALFHYFEVISVSIFSMEYLLRIWVADLYFPDNPPLIARLRWIFSFTGMVDLLAILPFYIPILIPFDLRFLRMIRVIRLMRLLKLGRYSGSLLMIVNVMEEKKEELISAFFISAILMIVSSTFMYHLEHDAQPDKFPNIIETFWWSMATLTTVGYGDVVPTTAGGKLVASIIAILGVGIIALPTGILSAGIIDKIKSSQSITIECPHCGKTHTRN